MSSSSQFRSLPSTDSVLRIAEVADLEKTFVRRAVVRLVRQVLADYRLQVAEGGRSPSVQAVADQVALHASRQWTVGLRPVINATGVILQTNLGRSPLSQYAIESMARISGYSDLEFDLDDGHRESRQYHVQSLLRGLLDAESSHITVNSAAAVFLALTVLTRGKEVIVSRGQSVEIGGGFRIPVIMRQSGAKIVEVGTTNRTRAADYEEAITSRTGAILHVHSSNFKIVGFAEQVALSDLARVAHRHDLPLIDDNGSGALLDTREFGLAHEPMPEESLQAGSDVVVFSGDKLLGGPQAGILVGRDDLISRIARHPLARALRPDKSILAALCATLISYLRGEAHVDLPVWQMISMSRDQLRERADRWAEEARNHGVSVRVEEGESTIGGGSLPGETLPTFLLRLPKSIGATGMRAGRVPVVVRTMRQHAVLDLRTVPPGLDPELLALVIEGAERATRQQTSGLDLWNP